MWRLKQRATEQRRNQGPISKYNQIQSHWGLGLQMDSRGTQFGPLQKPRKKRAICKARSEGQGKTSLKKGRDTVGCIYYWEVTACRGLGRSNNRYIIFKETNHETITNSREPKDTKKNLFSLAMSYIYIAIITMLYNDLMKNSVI